MANFKPLIVQSQAFYETLVAPQFADLVPTGQYNGILGEFTVMNDVSSKRPIIDIFGHQNILKRRDATCNLDFTPVARAKPRFIVVDEVYGATKQCDNEFYQGCLKDFREQSSVFRDYIMQFFEKAVRADIATNSYFGDITRTADATGTWNWNTFDGLFKKIAAYIASGVIPSGQNFAIPALSGGATALDPTDCYGILQDMETAQNDLMDAMPDISKAFYVDRRFAEAYERYLISIGHNSSIAIEAAAMGIPGGLHYNGIPILQEPLWAPILKLLNGGTPAFAAMLTLRGNFVFGTDKTYGEAPDLNEALRVWYSLDEMVWKYAMFLKAGVEIAFPQHLVLAMTSF